MTSVAVPSAELRLRLLGRWALYGADGGLLCPSGKRLLTFLALRGACSRRVLTATIWPDASDDKALASLRTALWRIRRVHPALVVGGDALALGDGVQVDVPALLALVQALAAREGARSTLTAVPEQLLSGDLVPGWRDEWLLVERERIRQLRLHALETLARTFAADGRYTLGLAAGLAAVRAEPLRESAQRAVIDLYLRAGDRGRARRHLEAYQHLLYQRLGVAPSPRTLRLLRDDQPAGRP
ncbi:AfsR/SARP family transcriptional regulator [Phytohabitans rumicis]|uniref:Bacterial transcriptional activator domain-containing protein n=1 Tax=Phytohabitans rumicis TaxID=1076125 RepID=A0A6V8LR33_9ACTN|nr:BTAD domain-containing putative transcriptional regulator [Phytohabitans rumicis]GFJ95195.1 hypothetical protein Prum_088370 [Phytohabitans rumicis]